MKSFTLLAFVVASFFAQSARADDAAAIGKLLDGFHAAAANAKFDAYFGAFAPEGIFLGTDASERWTIPEFREFAKPHFERGKGWTYEVKNRHVTLSPDQRYAVFDEHLNNAAYGRCRGSGTVRRIGNEWKIVQYHLSIPIPNELAGAVVKTIRSGKR